MSGTVAIRETKMTTGKWKTFDRRYPLRRMEFAKRYGLSRRAPTAIAPSFRGATEARRFSTETGCKPVPRLASQIVVDGRARNLVNNGEDLDCPIKVRRLRPENVPWQVERLFPVTAGNVEPSDPV